MVVFFKPKIYFMEESKNKGLVKPELIDEYNEVEAYCGQYFKNPISYHCDSAYQCGPISGVTSAPVDDEILT
jgi:hypothetical protein